MKNFSKYITEKATDAGYPVDGSDFTNDLAKPETITRINAFLGSMGKMEYLVPEHALNKMQEKLGRLGISFEMPSLSEDGGEMSVPLTQFGGIYGEDDAGEMVNGDGISHRVEGGLSLKIMHEKTAAGTHFLVAKIV
ncbi:MAG: hypothetical protein ACO293_08150 [Nitrosopumilaceae archaeon]|jgi:hypothetical protein